MSQILLKRDPFSPVATPAVYVPRPASEAAFARLERTVFDDGRVAVVVGPAGFGKTLLLRRLAEAARGRFSPVYLPYASLTPDELCSWTLESLGVPAAEEPAPAFRAWLGNGLRQGSPLLLLVDDATALPAETVRWLVQLAKEGALRLVLAGLEGDGPPAFGDEVPEDAERIRLAEPMSEQETRDYLCARLEMAEVPEAQRAAFDTAVVANLFELSHGNPRRLHQAASAVLRGVRPDAIVAFMDGLEPPPAPGAPTPLDASVLEPLYVEDEPASPALSEPGEGSETFELPEPDELSGPAEPDAGDASDELADSAGDTEPGAEEMALPRPCVEATASEQLSDPDQAVAEPVEGAASEVAPLMEARPESGQFVDPAGSIEAQQPAAAETSPEPASAVAHGEIALARHAPGRPGSLLLRRSGPRAELAAPPVPPIPEAAQVLADALGDDDPGLLEDLGLDTELPAPLEREASSGSASSPALPEDLPEPARLASEADLEETLQEAGQTLVRATGLLRRATLGLGAPGTPRGDTRAALREAVRALRDAIATTDTAVGRVSPPSREEEDPQARILLGALARVGTVVGVSALLGAAAVFLFQDRPEAPNALPPAPPVVQSRPIPAPAPPALAEIPEPAPAPELPAGVPTPTAPLAEEAAPAPETFHVGVNARPWAHVEVDGHDVGMTPIAALELEGGLHIFRARMPDGRIVVRRIEIGPETEPLVFR